MRAALTVTLLATIMGLAAASAADETAKQKAEICAGCHGDNGISQTENIPSLAGQQDQFIQWQLVFFRSGARKNEQMQPIAEQISNEDVRTLGAYFASLAPPKASQPDDNPDLSNKGAQAASGRRAHHRCRVEGWPWRMLFSRADSALIASSGNATSISFLR